jgi:murein DD-endopeptidase MepM/ murein hydrolase activator NlpD
MRLPTLSVGLVWLLAAGCGSSRPLHGQAPPGRFHVLEPGETLTQIAAREQIPLEDLLEVNGLGVPDQARPGQTVFVLAPSMARPALEEARPVAPPGQSPPPPRVAITPSAQASGANALLRWPLREPRVSSTFGIRQGRPHEGIDLSAPLGTPIVAARDGTVIYAGDGVKGYGNMVVVQHDGGLLTVYAHNSLLIARQGERVRQGQEIARVGQSGRATAPHLHFEVRRGDVPQDPLRFLPGLR